MTENYKNVKLLETEYDECNIRGVCSISPTFSAVKSLVFGYLQELSFYIIKIRSLGGRNILIKNKFLEIFAILIINNEIKEEDLINFIKEIKNTIKDTKLFYQDLCTQNNTNTLHFKQKIKLSDSFNFIDIIKQGQIFDEFYKKNFSDEQINGLRLILIVLKSIYLYIIELQSLDVDFDNYYEELLKAINENIPKTISVQEIKAFVEYYSKIDNELLKLVFESRKQTFGDLVESNIKTSPVEGKCILVSGSNMKELELLLKATENKGINIYTHGQMITGHSYTNLKKYTHLIGHYGKGIEYYISDFSTFPGPIFVTKVSLFKVENLYLSKIFSTSKIPVINTRQIIDYDFNPLIESALNSEGFTETLPEKQIRAGINENIFDKNIDLLIEKIKSSEIKNVFFIGVSNKTKAQIDYFKNLLELMKNDCYLISFYYQNHSKNILYNNLDYAFPFLYKTIEKLVEIKSSLNFKINILNTRCEPHTISNLYYLRTLNIDNIYFHQCSPLLINPTLVDLLLDWAKIERYTIPINDYNKMTSFN